MKLKRKWVVRKCSNCGKPGHQKRTCKADRIEPASDKMSRAAVFGSNVTNVRWDVEGPSAGKAERPPTGIEKLKRELKDRLEMVNRTIEAHQIDVDAYRLAIKAIERLNGKNS